MPAAGCGCTRTILARWPTALGRSVPMPRKRNFALGSVSAQGEYPLGGTKDRGGLNFREARLVGVGGGGRSGKRASPRGRGARARHHRTHAAQGGRSLV